MAHSVTWIDRLRIERVVWSLDQRLYDLPRRSRIERRREVRQNLLEAALDVGAPAALEQLGSTSRLAAEYLSAELGDEPRPHWTAAAVVLLGIPLFLTSLLAEAANAFGDGLLAGRPTAGGEYAWAGVPYLQAEVRFTVAGGHVTWTGGAFTPFTWALLLVVTVGAGRLWRVVPLWLKRRRRPVAGLTRG